MQKLAGISIAQFGALPDQQANLHQIARYARDAASVGSVMLFCPEYSMFYARQNRQDAILRAAEPVDGPFVQALGSIARENRLWLAAGIYELSDQLPYNTIVLLDDAGAFRASYRKRQLFNTENYRESDECRAGDLPFVPVTTPVGKLGIITCFELRFPALAAEQKDAGAEVLYVPAGWIAGENKILHWRTLLAARAIENHMTVLGVNQYVERLFTGYSAVFASDGTLIGELSEGSGLITWKKRNV